MKNFVARYLRERAGGLAAYRAQTRAEGQSGSVRLLNWWPGNDSRREWFRKFVLNRGIGKSVDICSLFGPRSVLGWSKADIRIFFSGENLHLARWSHYADYMLSGPTPFDLGLGFDYFEDEHYLRFPLWLTYMFPPESTEEDIRRICGELRHPSGNSGSKYCSLISRWDPSGVRGRIFEALRPFGEISCPSGFMHNDDSLVGKFGDDKAEYLKQFRFNICPENSNADGYTTEKIFESISAGCIPVYSGSFGRPEPEVLDPEAILTWKDGGDNSDTISIVRELESNRRAYEEFASRPRLVAGAEEWVLGKFEELGKRLDGAD